MEPGKAMDVREHPARNKPDATNHHWGTVASTADAATRGRKNSPLDEAMPTSPSGDLPRGSYDGQD